MVAYKRHGAARGNVPASPPRGGPAGRPRKHPCGLHNMKSKDSLPEWSKGVDSSSTSASCVGSNPTAVTFNPPLRSNAPILFSTSTCPMDAQTVSFSLALRESSWRNNSIISIQAIGANKKSALRGHLDMDAPCGRPALCELTRTTLPPLFLSLLLSESRLR